MRERLMPMIKVKKKQSTPVDKYKPKYAKNKFAEEEKQPTVSTFHSLCVKILRRRIDKLGYPLTFAIYNRGDQESLARSVLREISVNDKMLAPNQLLYHIGNWKCKSFTPDDAIVQSESDVQHLAAIAYQKYQRQLKLSGAVDFDDLLLLTEKLFREHDDDRREDCLLYTSPSPRDRG